MKKINFHTALWGIVFLLAGLSGPYTLLAGDLPKLNEKLPLFSVNAPGDKAERTYLGLLDSPKFGIGDIDAELVLIEIVGVYCPKCHQQFPKMRKLFNQVQKDSQLTRKIKFLSIAVGASPSEVAFLKKQFSLSYPIVTDPDFEIHKILEEPRTPFTMLVARDRTIVYTHLGVIEDFDKFLVEIRKLAG